MSHLTDFYIQVYSLKHKLIPEQQSREITGKIWLAANYSNLFLLLTTSHCPQDDNMTYYSTSHANTREPHRKQWERKVKSLHVIKYKHVHAKAPSSIWLERRGAIIVRSNRYTENKDKVSMTFHSASSKHRDFVQTVKNNPLKAEMSLSSANLNVIS